MRFNKNVFFANETAFAEVVVDNSKCELAVTCVEFVVNQKIYIHSQGKFGNYDREFYLEQDLLENHDKTRIEAGQ